jgi:Tol biopolymer transport system component
VEIRNQLTLELITTLQPAETIRHLVGPLAYSPDGRSIACASDTAIIIWDIQTGGVAKEIECSSNNISLVWSSDGRTLCTINSGDGGTFIVHMYDVSSGTTSSPGTLESGDHPHLWTDDGSFWVMTTARNRYPDNNTIDVFKVGSTLTKIESFTFPPSLHSEAKITSFSPTTHHISISDGNTLQIFDIRNKSAC